MVCDIGYNYIFIIGNILHSVKDISILKSENH